MMSRQYLIGLWCVFLIWVSLLTAECHGFGVWLRYVWERAVWAINHCHHHDAQHLTGISNLRPEYRADRHRLAYRCHRHVHLQDGATTTRYAPVESRLRESLAINSLAVGTHSLTAVYYGRQQLRWQHLEHRHPDRQPGNEHDRSHFEQQSLRLRLPCHP